MTLGHRGDITAYSESYHREDIFMQQARSAGAEIGAIDPSTAVGGLLSLLGKISGAKQVVEMGTGSGVGGLWLFQGLPSDGTLTSIDVERENSAAARRAFEEAGISALRYRLITGKVAEIVNKLADESYDFVVIRVAADLMELVQQSHRLLRTGGILFIDQALDGGKVADPTQRDFESIARRDGIRAIKEDARWQSSMVPVGPGVLIATKVG
jgi:predicted O-methyltransferase YrrM